MSENCTLHNELWLFALHRKGTMLSYLHLTYLSNSPVWGSLGLGVAKWIEELGEVKEPVIEKAHPLD